MGIPYVRKEAFNRFTPESQKPIENGRVQKCGQFHAHTLFTAGIRRKYLEIPARSLGWGKAATIWTHSYSGLFR